MNTSTAMLNSRGEIAAMTNNSTSAAHVRQVMKHLIPAIDSDEDSSQSESGSNGPSNTHGTFNSNSYDKKEVAVGVNEMHEASITPYCTADNTIHYPNNANTTMSAINGNFNTEYVASQNNELKPPPLAETTTSIPVKLIESVVTTATDKDELYSLHSFLTSTSKSRLPRRTAQKCFSSSHSEHDEVESHKLMSAHDNENSSTTNQLIVNNNTTTEQSNNDCRNVEHVPSNRWMKREELRKLYAIDDSSSISSCSSKSSSSYTSHEENANNMLNVENDEVEPTDILVGVVPATTESPPSTFAESVNPREGLEQKHEEYWKKEKEQEKEDDDDDDASIDNVFKTKHTTNKNFKVLQEKDKYKNEVYDGSNKRDVIPVEGESTRSDSQIITNNKTGVAPAALGPLSYAEDEIDEWQLTKTIEDSQGEVTNLESGRSPSEGSQASLLPESSLEQEDELEQKQWQEETNKKEVTAQSSKPQNEEKVNEQVGEYDLSEEAERMLNEERLEEKHEQSPLSDYTYDHDLQSAISFTSYAEKSITSLNVEHLPEVEKQANHDAKRKEVKEHSFSHAPSSQEKENNESKEEEEEQEQQQQQKRSPLASQTPKAHVEKTVVESVPTWAHRLSNTTNNRSSMNSNQSRNNNNNNNKNNSLVSHTSRSRSVSSASINSWNNDIVMRSGQSRLTQRSPSITSNTERQSKENINGTNNNNSNNNTKFKSKEVKSNTSSRARSQSIPDWVNRLSTPLARRSVSASTSRSSSVASFTHTSTKGSNSRRTPRGSVLNEGEESIHMQSARSLLSASHSMSEMHKYYSMKSNGQHSRSVSSEANTLLSAQSRPSTILTEKNTNTFNQKKAITATPNTKTRINSIAKKSESRSVSLVNKEHTLPRQPNTQSTRSLARSTYTPIKSSRSILSASESSSYGSSLQKKNNKAKCATNASLREREEEENKSLNEYDTKQKRRSLLSQLNSGNLSSAQVSRRTSLSQRSESQSEKSNSLVKITESKQDSLTNYVKELQQRQEMESGLEEEYENEWERHSNASHHSASSMTSSQTRKSSLQVAQDRSKHSYYNTRNLNNNNNNVHKDHITSSTLSSANRTSHTTKHTHHNESIMHTLRLDLRRREDRKELHKQQYCVDPQLQMRPCKRQFHITPQLDLFGVYERHNMTTNSTRNEQTTASSNWSTLQKTSTTVGKDKPQWQSGRKPFVVKNNSNNNYSNSARTKTMNRSQSANNGTYKMHQNDISMITRFVGGYDDDYDDANNVKENDKNLNKLHTYRSVSGKRFNRVNLDKFNSHKDQLNLFSWNTFNSAPTSNRSSSTENKNNNCISKIKSGRKFVAHRPDHLDRLLVPDRDCNSRSFSHRNDMSEERHFFNSKNYSKNNSKNNKNHSEECNNRKTTPYRTASQMMAALRAHFDAQPENTLTPRRQKWTEHSEQEKEEEEMKEKCKQRTTSSSSIRARENLTVKDKRLLSEVSPRRGGRGSKRMFTPHSWKDDTSNSHTNLKEDSPIKVYEDHDIFGVTARNAKLAARAAELSLEQQQQQQQQKQSSEQKNNNTINKIKRQLSEPYGNEFEEKRKEYSKHNKPTRINGNNDSDTDSDNDDEEFKIFTVNSRANMHNNNLSYANYKNGNNEGRTQLADRTGKQNDNNVHNHKRESTEPIALQNDEEEEAMLMFDLKRREQNTPLREPVEVE